MSRHFRYATRLSFEGNDVISTAIPHLSCMRLPFTISALVISVIVNSSKRVFWWALSHISKEIIETHPSFTNGYSTSTIKSKSPCLGFGASLNHVAPSIIGLGFFPVSGVSMGEPSFNEKFNRNAPTRLTSSWGEQFIGNYFLFSAGALTQRPRSNSTVWINFWRRVCNYFKPSKLASDVRYWCRHIIGYFNVVLSGGCSADTGTRCAIFSTTSQDVN